MALPTSHPLILELASLRAQLHTTQTAAHRSGLSLQSARLELSLAGSRVASLERALAAQNTELEVLRGATLPPAPAPSPSPSPLPSPSVSTPVNGPASVNEALLSPAEAGPSRRPNGATAGGGGGACGTGALAELSLAHRRLSAKLDLTEERLTSTQLELAGAQHEIVRLGREREGDRAAINELRRREGEWEDEIGWERGERRRAEEQKRLCDLALQEYASLVHELDPSAVPPPVPAASATAAYLASPPSLLDNEAEKDADGSEASDDGADGEPEAHPSTKATNADTVPVASAPTASSRPDDISNLLLGQRGVHQLVRDFVASLSAKDKTITELSRRAEELELSLSTVTKQLDTETALRVECMAERDRVLRDDASAAKVVERYMAYTQKTHATIHLHLSNLRKRASATQGTLRAEALDLRARLAASERQCARLAGAMDELSEGVARETAGGGGRLEVLVDEGLEAVAPVSARGEGSGGGRGSWLGRKKVQADAEATPEEESIARVLLAEELVNTLVRDLQSETERRMELEKQRIEWITRDALHGHGRAVVEEEGVKEEVFDMDAEEAGAGTADEPSGVETLAPVASALASASPGATGVSPLPSPAPAVSELRAIFHPLEGRYAPLQTRLHSLAHALSALRAEHAEHKSGNHAGGATGAAFLGVILDNLHEALEDARVDVEIALADQERVYRGFEALLNVGKAEAVRGGEVLEDARGYVAVQIGQEGGGATGYGKLERRVGDLEGDTAGIKARLASAAAAGAGEDGNEGGGGWADMELKSITVLPADTESSPGLASPGSGSRSPLRSTFAKGGANANGLANGERRGPIGLAGSMGRSFSASIVGAPRKMQSFAGGLYRPRRGQGAVGDGVGEKEKGKAGAGTGMDDVE